MSSNSVMSQFVGSSIAAEGENYLGLNPDNLYIVRKKKEADDDRVHGWRCPVCSAFFLHATGRRSVCPNCRDTQLIRSVTQESFDYYVYLAEQSGPAFRLHCEELTGQTDDADRPRRQRWFQEVFIEDEKALAPSGRGGPPERHHHHGGRRGHRSPRGRNDGQYAAKAI